ncbi:alpha/beta hydrolase [Arachidicoccus terrestris]|uniref:alpha/beta hydrolase n=1 Tax=Arachidicoccus terrestris TaxID=2875539 RepID=UPI001CC56FFB|nr:alpha/beta hydrolase [Arachidicoccus terrestris]UAY57028.1 alpha/beta hydrolase [Arachidicoccus terrestris]
MSILKILLIGLCLSPLAIHAQRLIKLYPRSIPNSKETSLGNVPESPSAGMIRRVVTPTLQLFLPKKDKASGAAVVICPGGGYSVIVYKGEGIMTAKDFVEKGVAAFVLQYRLPNDSFQVNKTIAPLQDAQQAIKLVRDSASVWGIDSKKVGIMGFSAGGHLASTEATHYRQALIDNQSHTNLRPDFQILVYPVISMQDNLTHVDSRRKLLGTEPLSGVVDLYSNELQVDEGTPPAYITQAADDKVVDVDNSIVYFEKLRHVGIPVEMHIYQKGNHGFVFRHPGWMSPLFEWMELNGWIKK